MLEEPEGGDSIHQAIKLPKLLKSTQHLSPCRPSFCLSPHLPTGRSADPGQEQQVLVSVSNSNVNPSIHLSANVQYTFSAGTLSSKDLLHPCHCLPLWCSTEPWGTSKVLLQLIVAETNSNPFQISSTSLSTLFFPGTVSVKALLQLATVFQPGGLQSRDGMIKGHGGAALRTSRS